VLNEQLTHALRSRILIEQAKGVLAERGTLSMDDAFAQLRAYARNNNARLTDVAGDIVSGALAITTLVPSTTT
jgi:AmiR/NasT family two-component response regulator